MDSGLLYLPLKDEKTKQKSSESLMIPRICKIFRINSAPVRPPLCDCRPAADQCPIPVAPN